MKTSTSAIISIAVIVGLGTTVFTVATTEPAKVDVVDNLTTATAGVVERPNLIDSWSRVARLLISREEPLAMVVDQWLGDFGDERAATYGAEAMIWYAISNDLARRDDRFVRDYTIPAAVAARKKSIDLLLKHSQTSPDDMQYWHWNSLAWAWVRSGQYRSARGALERTEAALRALPADYPSIDIATALERLASCWGPNGLGDTEGQIAALRIGEALFLKHGERWPARPQRMPTNVLSLALAIGASGDPDAEAELFDRTVDRYESEMPTEDRRAAWFTVVNVYDRGLMTEPDLSRVEPWTHALEMLSAEIEEHGQRGDMNWNRIGWSYWHAQAKDDARAAWAKWLEFQEASFAESQSAGGYYNIACGRSLTGDHDGAIKALAKAIELGWWDREDTQRDRDFAFLADDERFHALLAEMTKRHEEQYREFQESIPRNSLRPPIGN